MYYQRVGRRIKGEVNSVIKNFNGCVMIPPYGAYGIPNTKDYRCLGTKNTPAVPDVRTEKSPSGHTRIVRIYQLCCRNSTGKIHARGRLWVFGSARCTASSSFHSNTYKNSLRHAHVQQLWIHRVLQCPRPSIGRRFRYPSCRNADSLICRTKPTHSSDKSSRVNLPTPAVLSALFTENADL